MKLKVLGCSGGIGGARARTTSFLIDSDTLIDCGTGVGDLELEELVAIDHIFITHSHMDHITSIPLLIDSVGELRRMPVTVVFPPVDGPVEAVGVGQADAAVAVDAEALLVEVVEAQRLAVLGVREAVPQADEGRVDRLVFGTGFGIWRSRDGGDRGDRRRVAVSLEGRDDEQRRRPESRGTSSGLACGHCIGSAAGRPWYGSGVLVLASASPRRADLLRGAGVGFTVVGVNADEGERPGEPPAAYAARVARAKAALALPRHHSPRR